MNEERKGAKDKGNGRQKREEREGQPHLLIILLKVLECFFIKCEVLTESKFLALETVPRAAHEKQNPFFLK